MYADDTVFCHSCGEIDQSATNRLLELQQTITALGVEVAKKAGQIKRLTRQQSENHPPEYDGAMEVAQYWRRMVRPGARELNGARITNTIQRLQHGYEVTDLKRCVWGYSCKPNMGDYGKRLRKGEGGRFKADLSFICKDAEHVDIGIQIADEEERYDQQTRDDGGSRYVALLCGCGHPRADHALYRRHGHEACLRKDERCSCEDFDDVAAQAELFRARQERTGTLM